MTETTIIAEYGSRFDADLAVAKLSGHDIIAATWSDPAASIAPHHVTDRVFRVVVHADAAEDARALLESDPAATDLDEQFYFQGFAQRPVWVRNTTLIVLAAVAGPVLVTVTILAFGLLAHFMP
ncbi:MAG: hypothetical protein IH940_09020 [Acidobacteria bacterium]|nr:hypothetical protein [Acidobacteriota bacterium]